MAPLRVLVVLVALSATAAGETVLLDFYNDRCPGCVMMAPLMDQFVRSGYPVRKINTGQHPQLTQQYRVSAVPCFVMVVDGEVVDRVDGPTTITRIEQMFHKAQTAEMNRSGPTAGPRVPFSGRDSNDPLPGISGNGAQSRQPEPQYQQQPAPGRTRTADPRGGRDAIMARALAASVRLKVEDATGFNYGSGTIVDSYKEEALVLTCAHVFRASQGRGPIHVDVFTPRGNTTVAGTLIAWNLDKDVALVAIKPGISIEPMKVAPANHRLRVGERLISIGCDRGMNPSVGETRVISVNNVPGRDTLQVAGRPVDGRSGGGLFTTDGYVVGVCNGAFQGEDKGLFAGLRMIQSELDRADLAFVYAPQQDNSAIVENTPSRQRISPAAAPPARGSLSADGLTAQERSLIEAVRRGGPNSEIVCVVSGGQLRVVDRPSPGLLSRLHQEHQFQNGANSMIAKDGTRTLPR
jgi:thiol-disulfide isomerase/thioredoxin